MEKLEKPQDIYVRQRRWATAFFAFLSLILCACMVILPIALANTTPEDNLTEGQVTAIIALASVAAFAFGVPLLFVFVALCIKLKRKHVIYADEKGIYIYNTIVPYGLIPWDNIKEIRYYGVFSFSALLFAPDTNHLKIDLRSKEQFLKGLNFSQKLYFRLNFSRLFCNMQLCKGNGQKLNAELNKFLVYYTGDNDSAE